MAVDDLSLKTDPATVVIRRGKGGRGRVVPLSVEGLRASIDKYLRGPESLIG